MFVFKQQQQQPVAAIFACVRMTDGTFFWFPLCFHFLLECCLPEADAEQVQSCRCSFVGQNRNPGPCEKPEPKCTCTGRKQRRGRPWSQCKTSAADRKPGSRSPEAWVHHHPEKWTRTGSGSAASMDLPQYLLFSKWYLKKIKNLQKGSYLFRLVLKQEVVYGVHLSVFDV